MSKVLAVLLELKECSDYWSEYAVPIGIHERIDEAIAEFGKDNVVVLDDIQALEPWGDIKSRACWALGLGKFQ